MLSQPLGLGRGYRVGATFRSAVTIQLHIPSQRRDLQPGNIYQHTPCPPVHWTLLFRRCSPYPLKQTVHVKYMTTFPPNCRQRYVSHFLTSKSKDSTEWAVITRHFATRATALIRHSTNAANVAFIVLGLLICACIPAPCSDCVPVLHCDFHCGGLK
jgi:hypothetical protein